MEENEEVEARQVIDERALREDRGRCDDRNNFEAGDEGDHDMQDAQQDEDEDEEVVGSEDIANSFVPVKRHDRQVTLESREMVRDYIRAYRNIRFSSPEVSKHHKRLPRKFAQKAKPVKHHEATILVLEDNKDK